MSFDYSILKDKHFINIESFMVVIIEPIILWTINPKIIIFKQFFVIDIEIILENCNLTTHIRE